MKGISIFHDELAAAHYTKARSYFITELGLNLVVIDGQLLVAAKIFARDVCDDFFMGWSHAAFSVVSVFKAQQLGAELLPAAGFFPQFTWLYRRHEHFGRTGSIHFFADDVFDLAQHPQAQRHPGVETGCEAADHTGPQHELVADDLCIGG